MENEIQYLITETGVSNGFSSVKNYCEWHFQSFWVRKVALEVFKEILGPTIAILSQQNRVFFSFGFFPAKCEGSD